MRHVVHVYLNNIGCKAEDFVQNIKGFKNVIYLVAAFKFTKIFLL
jgi:hypothetical protein